MKVGGVCWGRGPSLFTADPEKRPVDWQLNHGTSASVALIKGLINAQITYTSRLSPHCQPSSVTDSRSCAPICCRYKSLKIISGNFRRCKITIKVLIVLKMFNLGLYNVDSNLLWSSVWRKSTLYNFPFGLAGRPPAGLLGTPLGDPLC